jgi:hypothetical protein
MDRVDKFELLSSWALISSAKLSLPPALRPTLCRLGSRARSARCALMWVVYERRKGVSTFRVYVAQVELLSSWALISSADGRLILQLQLRPTLCRLFSPSPLCVVWLFKTCVFFETSGWLSI